MTQPAVAAKRSPNQENKSFVKLRQNDPNLCRLEVYDSMIKNANAIIELGKSLHANTHLRRLDFAVHHHWTLACAQAMAAGIQHSNIHALWITLKNDNECQGRNGNNVHQSWYHLLKNLRHARLLQQLTLVSTPIDATDEEEENIVGQLVSSLPVLQQLSLLRASSPCQIPSLAQALRETSSLIRLEICDTNLNGPDGATCMGLLAMGLTQPKKLNVRFLRLESNRIDDLGMVAFVEHWNSTCDSILQELCLARNHIGATGASLLIRAIAQHHPKLKYVSLDDNKNIGYVGLEQIGRELHTLRRSFTRLSLRGCVTEQSCNDEVMVDSDKSVARNKILAQRAYDALLEGIHANVYLRELSVSNNALLDTLHNDNGHNLEWYCQLNRIGRYLLTHQSHSHQLPATVWCHVLSQCSRGQMASAMYYFLREQPHLVSNSCQ